MDLQMRENPTLTPRSGSALGTPHHPGGSPPDMAMQAAAGWGGGHMQPPAWAPAASRTPSIPVPITDG